MANSDSNEDRLLGAALGKTAQCPSLEALAAMDATARAHVEQCAYCRNELAMLVEFQDATPLPAEAADLAWIQSELKRRSAAIPAAPSKSPWASINDWIARAFPSRGWRMVPVAAGLVLVAAGVMYLGPGNEALRPPAPGDPVWRSQSVAGVAPVGDVAAPSDLQWEAVSGAVRYAVRVMEVDGTEIWRAEGQGTRIALPPGVRAQMTAGRSFLWTITARSEKGSTVAESSLQSFHILATSR